MIFLEEIQNQEERIAFLEGQKFWDGKAWQLVEIDLWQGMAG